MLDQTFLPCVSLTGADADLESLAILLRDGDHRVIQEEKMFWLHSKKFVGIHDPGQIRNKAEDLISIVNGAAKAVFPTFSPVDLHQCIDYLSSDGRRRRKLHATIRVVWGTPAATEGSAADLLARAMDDKQLADTLRLWGSARSHDSITLYNLKEKVSAALGGDDEIVRCGWATKDELRLFGWTANSNSVLGHAARHGVQRCDPPPRPMTIDAARKLIGHVIRSYCGSTPDRALRSLKSSGHRARR